MAKIYGAEKFAAKLQRLIRLERSEWEPWKILTEPKGGLGKLSEIK